GDVTATSGSYDWYGECFDDYARLKLVGSGAQNITVAPGVDSLPHIVEIASTGTVTLNGTLATDGWKYTSGTFAQSGTVQFVTGYSAIEAAGMSFNHVIFGSTGDQYWA